MIRHWFRLLWGRRSSNAAIVAEISICFLVLCTVAAALLHATDKAQAPLGYEWKDTFVVSLGFGPYYEMEDEERAVVHAEAAVVLRALENHPDVVAAAFSGSVPYERSRWNSGIHSNREVVYFIVGEVSLNADDALALDLAEGRWFEAQDVGSPDFPVVISRGLARTLFGDVSPIGLTIPNEDADGIAQEDDGNFRMGRVIGVVDDYRRLGEFGAPHEMMFRLLDFDSTAQYLPSRILVRAGPNADSAVEESLLETLRTSAPGWDSRITSLASMRGDRHREQLFLPITGLVVAAFLVLMVGLGLVGVLWQSVSRRTAEFGLRRALGGAAGDIRGLVLGELVALASVSAVIGALVFLQAPLLGIVTGLSVQVWIGAVAVAAIVLYSFVLLCGLYPSWLATRIEPAQALQYE